MEFEEQSIYFSPMIFAKVLRSVAEHIEGEEEAFNCAVDEKVERILGDLKKRSYEWAERLLEIRSKTERHLDESEVEGLTEIILGLEALPHFIDEKQSSGLLRELERAQEDE